MITKDVLKINSLESEQDLEMFFDNIEEYIPQTTGLYDRLKDILGIIGFPCTVICEYGYVDKIYRNMYYHYFAGKHNGYDRNCKRLSVFKGVIEEVQFYKYDEQSEEKLQQAFVGTIVIRPLDAGKIGRTLIDPSKLHIESSAVRLTQFEAVIAGHQLKIKAFPYSSQDTETMTCAETTVWTILEYYGTRYPEYRTILPNEIYNELSRISNERVWPSKGLSYEKVSDLLKTFGFSPRIYALHSYIDENTSADRNAFVNCQEYKRLFHYYVESGIPFAVGIEAQQPEKLEHSMVCIGHTNARKPVSEITKRYIQGVPYIDSADYYESYVMIDDNRKPYQIDRYADMNFYGQAYIDVFAVPLYKRILMEANDAMGIIESLLDFEVDNFNAFMQDFEELQQGEDAVNEENPIVIRLMLTSSRKFKSIRAKNAESIEEAAFYANVSYPKFLWIAEITTHKAYARNKVYGEIVLDATASVSKENNNYENSIILMRYFSHIGLAQSAGKVTFKRADGTETERYSTKFENILDMLEENQEHFSDSFKMYFNNLENVGIGGAEKQ